MNGASEQAQDQDSAAAAAAAFAAAQSMSANNDNHNSAATGLAALVEARQQLGGLASLLTNVQSQQAQNILNAQPPPANPPPLQQQQQQQQQTDSSASASSRSRLHADNPSYRVKHNASEQRRRERLKER